MTPRRGYLSGQIFHEHQTLPTTVTRGSPTTYPSTGVSAMIARHGLKSSGVLRATRRVQRPAYQTAKWCMMR
jgi:hypothetical protein